VSGSTSGYRLSGGDGSIVLVRVPYFSIMTLEQSGYTLSSALGSVDSIILGSTNATQFSTTLAATQPLNLGLAIMTVTFGVWLVAEFVWLRWNRRRFTPAHVRVDREQAQPATAPSANQVTIDSRLGDPSRPSQ
jgi:hypothetical protein